MTSARSKSLIDVRNIIQLFAQINNILRGWKCRRERARVVDWICACFGILILIINDQVRSMIGGATGLNPNFYDK